MEIYFEEGQEVSPEILETMKKSAARCLELEGVDESRTEISVSFVEAEEIKRLNAEYRQVDSVTDVLSFPQFDDMKDKADDAFSKAKDVTNKAKSKFAKEKDDDDDDVNVDDINICDKDCEKWEDPCEERCDDCKYDEFHPENN